MDGERRETVRKCSEGKRTNGQSNSSANSSKNESKEEKLKKALRANLQRRKAKARALKDGS